MQRTQLEDPRDISKLDPFWSTKYHFHQTHCGCTHIQTTGHGIEDVINTSVYICAVYLSVVGGVHMRPKCICRMSINIAYLVITSLHTRTKYVFVDINISYIYIYICFSDTGISLPVGIQKWIPTFAGKIRKHLNIATCLHCQKKYLTGHRKYLVNPLCRGTQT